MKIEAGKYYRTRDGRKVGPMKYEDHSDNQPWTDGARYYCHDGNWLPEGHPSSNDLIAEWTDEPAAPKPSPFVTRRELVPGMYGRVFVRHDEDGLYVRVVGCVIAADELDEAAHLFTQLAEYLRETK